MDNFYLPEPGFPNFGESFFDPKCFFPPSICGAFGFHSLFGVSFLENTGFLSTGVSRPFSRL